MNRQEEELWLSLEKKMQDLERKCGELSPEELMEAASDLKAEGEELRDRMEQSLEKMTESVRFSAKGEALEEEQLAQLRPTRKEVGVIYRMAAEGYRGGEDVIGCRMKRAGVGYAKLLTSLRILNEGGLLHIENDGFVLKIEPSAHSAKDGKIALENTPTAQRVGYSNA